jgi:hypothetical protein
MKNRRSADGEDKTLLVFLDPPELRSTAFLQFSHRDREAEQWLYLPAYKRVRQITSRSKRESYGGTDFSFADLEILSDVIEWTEDDARSNLRGSESVGGQEAYLIELTPGKRDVGYSKIVVALAKSDLVPRRLEFYGTEAQPHKVLTIEGVRNVGAIPTPVLLVMKQPAAGSQTILDVVEVRYDQNLQDDAFSQRSLERGAEAIQ